MTTCRLVTTLRRRREVQLLPPLIPLLLSPFQFTHPRSIKSRSCICFRGRISFEEKFSFKVFTRSLFSSAAAAAAATASSFRHLRRLGELLLPFTAHTTSVTKGYPCQSMESRCRVEALVYLQGGGDGKCPFSVALRISNIIFARCHTLENQRPHLISWGFFPMTDIFSARRHTKVLPESLLDYSRWPHYRRAPTAGGGADEMDKPQVKYTKAPSVCLVKDSGSGDILH